MGRTTRIGPEGLLTREGVPTATGRSRWYASSVRTALSARANDRQAGIVTG